MNPVEINPDSGYRYYSIGQLKTMLFINRLKSYHFSLEEIKEILGTQEDQAEEKLYSALTRKRSEIQEKLHALEYTLKQMNSDLLHLEKGIPVMSYLDDIDVNVICCIPEKDLVVAIVSQFIMNPRDRWALIKEQIISTILT